MNYATLLETYDLSEILEMNDLTQEDVLEYMVETKYIRHLPEVLPLEFDD